MERDTQCANRCGRWTHSLTENGSGIRFCGNHCRNAYIQKVGQDTYEREIWADSYKTGGLMGSITRECITKDRKNRGEKPLAPLEDEYTVEIVNGAWTKVFLAYGRKYIKIGNGNIQYIS